MEIDALPKVIRGKGVEIHIDAPILSDAEAIKAACAEALQHVSEMMVSDVVFFADKPGTNFRTYGGKEAYYESGMIPYWRGGLVGSFADSGSDGWDSRNLVFTASYAEKIQNGGIPADEVPVEWWQEKLENPKSKGGVVYLIHSHPYVETVTQKFNDGAENFGYLDMFASTFVGHFNAYI